MLPLSIKASNMSLEVMFAKKAVYINIGGSKTILNNAGQYCFIGGKIEEEIDQLQIEESSIKIRSTAIDHSTGSVIHINTNKYINAAIREFKEETGVNLNNSQYTKDCEMIVTKCSDEMIIKFFMLCFILHLILRLIQIFLRMEKLI